MAGKEKLESYSPKMVHAGDFPVVTDSGTVASGETIHELMPITLGTDGKIKAVTADTVADVYGLAAENAEEGEEVVYYLTGEFFGSAIEVPVGKTAADFKAPFRKIGIFLVDTDNATAWDIVTNGINTIFAKKSIHHLSYILMGLLLWLMSLTLQSTLKGRKQ